MIFQSPKEFIQYLDKEKKFFNNVDEINKYNLESIIELIQYYNIKEYNNIMYSKREIRNEIKKYFCC